MKKKTIKILALSMLMIGSIPASAQQKEPSATSSGSPIITIFGDGGVGVGSQGISSVGFNLERAYLGYQYKLNSHWQAKVVYDMGKGDDKSIERMGYIKNAEIDYAKGHWKLNMGLTSTAQFNFQEKFWSYRYVYKSMMDQCKWGNSADLGLRATYQATDWLSADVSVFNGEGYKKIQSDKAMLYGLGLTIQPLQGLSLRLYGDMRGSTDTVSQYNMAFFIGYKKQSWRLGAEYNMQLNHSNSEGRDLQALSVYGACRIADHTEVYARYDRGTSDGPQSWSYGHDGNTAIVGLHYQANQLLSVSPNIRINLPQSGNATNVYACVSAKINL